MTRKEAMQAMLEKITAGEFFGDLPRPLEFHTDLCFKAFSGDLNAAKSLHESVLPGWLWGRHYSGQMWIEQNTMPGYSERFYGKSPDPAVAWLMAIIACEIARCE